MLNLSELTDPELVAVTRAFMAFDGALDLLERRRALPEDYDLDLGALGDDLLEANQARAIDYARPRLNDPAFTSVLRPDGRIGYAPADFMEGRL